MAPDFLTLKIDFGGVGFVRVIALEPMFDFIFHLSNEGVLMLI